MSRPRPDADTEARLSREDLGLPPALWGAFEGREDLRRALATACRLAWSEEEWAARQGEELCRTLAAAEPAIRSALFAPLALGDRVALTDGPWIPLALLARLAAESEARGEEPWPDTVMSVSLERTAALLCPPLPASTRTLALIDAPALEPEGEAPFLPALTTLRIERAPRAEPWSVDVLPGHRGWVRTVAWSPNGVAAATAGGDGRLLIWHPGEEGWRAVAELEGHGRPISALAWQPRGGRIATASADQTVRIWTDSAGRWHEMTSLPHPAEVTGLDWSPDGTRLLTVADDSCVRVWSPTSDGWRPEELTGHGGLVQVARWSSDGVRIASAGGDATVRVWIDDGSRFSESIVVAEHEDWVRTVDWSPDGTRLACGSDDGTARVVALRAGWLGRLRRPHAPKVQGREGSSLTGHEAWVRRVAFDRTGQRVATAADDGILRIYPATELEEEIAPIASFEHGSRIPAIAWSRSGAFLATGADDGTLRVFPGDREGPLDPVEGTGHEETIGAISWHPTRPALLTGSDDRTARVWSPAETGLGSVWRTLLERGEAEKALKKRRD